MGGSHSKGSLAALPSFDDDLNMNHDGNVDLAEEPMAEFGCSEDFLGIGDKSTGSGCREENVDAMEVDPSMEGSRLPVMTMEGLKSPKQTGRVKQTKLTLMMRSKRKPTGLARAVEGRRGGSVDLASTIGQPAHQNPNKGTANSENGDIAIPKNCKRELAKHIKHTNPNCNGPAELNKSLGEGSEGNDGGSMDLEPVDEEPTHQRVNDAAANPDNGGIAGSKGPEKTTAEHLKQIDSKGNGSSETNDSDRGRGDGNIETSNDVELADGQLIRKGPNNAGIETDSGKIERSGPEVKTQEEKQNGCQADGSGESNAAARGVCEGNSENTPSVEAADGQLADQSPNTDDMKSSSTNLVSRKTESQTTEDANPLSPNVRTPESPEVEAAGSPNPGDPQGPGSGQRVRAAG
ncbi:hypothetical protein BDW69DRAFT_20384 [Aspergillus filifer]